ncbi:MAG TPA: hypothetical protein VLA89_06725, partial [Gemmatimonadales bacterium]|nr:hypothetical protein [Gemmatimonadales bacterium]
MAGLGEIGGFIRRVWSATGDMIYRGANGAPVTLPIGSEGDVLTVASGVPSWAAGGGGGGITTEQAVDAVATALGAGGTGITITYDDPSDTITIDSDITQYTDEMARDALGTALVGGTGITITVDDGLDTITVDSDITQYTDPDAVAAVAAADDYL